MGDRRRIIGRGARSTFARSWWCRPNNPTGSFISAEEFQRISTLCRHRKWALIVDEVFADYPLDASHPLTDMAVRSEVLCFTLAGLSKTIGLPQLKLGWCIAGGPSGRTRRRAGGARSDRG